MTSPATVHRRHRRPKVATITVGTNEKRWLPDCLSTLLTSHTPDLDLAVWYSDNASTDGSTALVRDDFPSARIIQNDSNLGFAQANNVGMRAALADGADYVFLVNPDTRTPPDLIHQLSAFMERHPEYGICGPMQYVYTDNGPVSLDEHNEWSRTALRLGEADGFVGDRPFRPSPAGPAEGRAPDTLEHAYVQGAAFFVRAEVLRTIGLFDRVFHTYYEETDLCRRARWAGWRVALNLRLGIQHFGGGGTGASTYRRVQMRRNRYYFLFTDITWSWPAILGLAGRWLRQDLLGHSVGGNTTPLRGCAETAVAAWWLLRLAPTIARRRRAHRRLRAIRPPKRTTGGAL
ncbi:glycosyltransferase family 2 protein [Streptomyces sp. NBC_00102]|uniref:glycosyltransferase family 2 protein n=1 Tax=Streptomyces sp. NBC_00102 TaxID=2975652 RepID=UPI002253D61B|nr:glycosyltransferase family 2 protein [Streptomyces sp. NBC_00102]MCX5397194.1 glycosyltransferase family 2 protein [Streptomyces sp. NBC_00102]